MFLRCQKDYQKSNVLVLSTNEVSYDGSTKNGVTFSASILLDSKHDVVEQGFVMGLKKEPTIDDEVLKVNELNDKSFSFFYDYVLVPDTTYYLRSYAKTEKYLIYGNLIEFFSSGSQPPVISKIEPSIAFWGDTILITGENFDRNGKNNKVLFNSIVAPLIWGNSDSIKVIVPPNLDVYESVVCVNLYGNSSDKKEFKILSPLITGINTDRGQYPDTIIIEGQNLSEYYGRLLFGDISLEPIRINPIKNPYLKIDKLHFQVPFLGDEQDVDLEFNQAGSVVSVSPTFHYNEQSILGLSVDSIYATDTITLYAKNIDFSKVDVITSIESLCNKVGLWKDSARLIPNIYYKDYAHEEFNVNCQVYSELYKNLVTIYNSSVIHRKPKITKVFDSTIPYGGKLEISTDGTYGGRCLLHFKGIDRPNVTGSIAMTSSSAKYFIYLAEEMLPGQYEIWLENNSRFSNKKIIEVPYPVVSSIPNNIIKRGDKLFIEGVNLPFISRAYQLRHIQSNLVFKRPNESITVDKNEYTTLNLIGKGEYRLEFLFGDELYPTDHNIILEDYFSYETTCEEFDYEPHGELCFAKDYKLYYLLNDEKAMRVIDMNTGHVEKITTNIRLADSHIPGELYAQNCIFPTIINDNIYICHDYHLLEFNFDFMHWDDVVVEAENDSVIRTAEINNELIVNTKNNKVYRYNGSWQELGEFHFDYYTFGIGEYFYTGFNNGFSKVLLSDFNNTTYILSPLYRFNYYYAFKHFFVYNDEIYECFVRTYYLELARLSPRDDSFEKLEPNIISRSTTSTRFFPDVNGDVYYLVNNVVYKFTPDE